MIYYDSDMIETADSTLLRGEQIIESDPVVSIVVITYNSEQWITDTLNSIYYQSYHNIELVISDDSSKDRTVDICDEWLNKNGHRFSSYRILKAASNTGISANFNRGVFSATGDYIKILAGDDILLEHSINAYVDFIKRNPNAEWIYGRIVGFVNTFKEENIDHVFQSNCYSEEEIAKYSLPIHELKRSLAIRNFLKAPASFFSKQSLIKVNGSDESFPMCEDYSLCMRLLEAGYRPYFLDVETVGYRRNSFGVSSTNNKSLFNYRYLESEFGIIQEYCFKYLTVRGQLNKKSTFWIQKTMKSLGMTKNKFGNSFLYRASIRLINFIF